MGLQEREAAMATTDAATVDAIFEAVDTNSDGFIDAEEIHMLCQAMSSEGGYVPNMKAYKELLNTIDKKPPYGRIDKAEFSRFWNTQDEHQLPSLELVQGVKGGQGRYLVNCTDTEVVSKSDSACWFLKNKKLGEGKYAAVELWTPTQRDDQSDTQSDMSAMLANLPRKTNGEAASVAVKTFAIEYLDKKNKKKTRTKKEVYDVIQEFLTMRHTLNRVGVHRNVVQLYALIETPKWLYLLLEFVPFGDLYQYTNQKTMKETDAQVISCQILEGLQYIHANDIIHLDLKPENIMVYTAPKHGDEASLWHVKIADFGLSEVIVERDAKHHRFPGSPLYCSPEVFSHDRHFDEKADLWSVGTIFFEMICHATPWTLELPRKSKVDTIEKVKGRVMDFKGMCVANDKVCAIKGCATSVKMLEMMNKSQISTGAQRVIAHLLITAHADRPNSSTVLSDEYYASTRHPTLQDFDMTTPEWQHLGRVVSKFTGDIRNLQHLQIAGKKKEVAAGAPEEERSGCRECESCIMM